MISSNLPCITSGLTPKLPLMTTPSLPVQPSHSSPKHPQLGLWNPTWQGWLSDGVAEICDDAAMWTTDFQSAQTFRTEPEAQIARMRLRDYHGIHVRVCVLNYA